MPKVTRKETAAAPLQAVPSAAAGMEIEAGSEQLPPKPSFGALSAQDQAGNKVEFRRVSTTASGACSAAPHRARPLLRRRRRARCACTRRLVLTRKPPSSTPPLPTLCETPNRSPSRSTA